MAKNNSGLIVLVLILALGGSGLGIYSVFIQPSNSETSPISQIWTVKQDSVFYPGSSYSDMTDMDVDITVEAGETVYVIFNAQFSNGPTGGSGWLTGAVRITRDNVVIQESERSFIFDSTVGISVGNSLTTQFIIEGLAAGTYEFEVQATALAEVGTERVEDGLLYIYTYR
ncbi:MAG: hypothetical protein ACTSRE_02145 [Promethearchaeota archaeon]